MTAAAKTEEAPERKLRVLLLAVAGWKHAYEARGTGPIVELRDAESALDAASDQFFIRVKKEPNE